MAEESIQERNERALNATSTDELEELAADEDEDVRLRVARNANTPASVLEQLAADENWQVRFNVAENMNTPLSVLEKLAEDDERDIRNYVAKNENTSVSILEKLADDKDDYLRINVAEHKNTSVSVLEKLAVDENWQVREKVAEHKNTSVSVLEKLAADENWQVREKVAEHKNTSVSLLEKLGNDEEQAVRYWVAQNENTPVSVLEKLAGDEEEDIRQQVAENKSTPVSVLQKMGMSKDSTRNEQDTVSNKYELTMGRIGGEVVVGSITKEQYDYWVNKNDDEIYQHFLEDDIEESEVPSDAWIGNRWFEMDNVEHLNGCELSIDNKIVVCFDGNERSCVFECDLDKGILEKEGVKIRLDGVNFKELKEGYYFLYHPIEKGGLTIEIETESDFDPIKLTLVGTELVMPKNKGIYISSVDYEGGNVIEGDGFGDGVFTDTHWVEFFKVA